MGKTSFARLLMLLILLSAFWMACRPGPKNRSETTKAPSTLGAALKSRTECEPGSTASEDYALVQVLIYGLAVFEFDPDFQEDPAQIRVHFPAAGGHDLQILKGVENSGVFSLAKVATSPPTQIVGISLSPPSGALSTRLGTDALGKDPKNAEQARDVRWLARAKYIDDYDCFQDGSTSCNSPPSGATLQLDAGTLETCGLVHDNAYEGVCEVTFASNGLTRSMSEYMVLRALVPKSSVNQIKVSLKLSTGGPQHHFVPEVGKTLVKWNGTTYDKVFDIVIRNEDQNANREYVTTHANMHLKPYFKNASANWKLSSPDCFFDQSSGKWKCSCAGGDLQPCCLQHFTRYFPPPGGTNRAICPFVEHP